MKGGGGGGGRWRGREELVLFLRPYVANRDGYIRASEGERDGREERVVSRTNRREREDSEGYQERIGEKREGVSRKNRRERERERESLLKQQRKDDVSTRK